MLTWDLNTLPAIELLKLIFRYVSFDESIKEVKNLSHRKTSRPSHIPAKFIKGPIFLFFVQQLYNTLSSAQNKNFSSIRG